MDTEHEKVVRDDLLGPLHEAKRRAALERIAGAAGEPCGCIRFDEVSPLRVQQAGASALVLSGNTTDWSEYDFQSLEGLFRVIRQAPVPILGICAGHQLIGRAHGASWGPMGPLQGGEVDPDPRFAPGQRKEVGFLPLRVDADCPLFRGHEDEPSFYQSHYWELREVPAGFVARASSPWSPLQAIERLDCPVFGVQFHPEKYDAAHPDGLALLRAFLQLARELELSGRRPIYGRSAASTSSGEMSDRKAP
ncbi:MAG: gamma-glutamyl-gamma-aminobutyrate hydrolase family protein [Chloroflexi bacterium]|nr:gamma-glutamyl-gamma-aminobutyrate hydrolase family protein [Chloroflexota bacterium]